ncbi:MAG: hypothetical protein K8T10_20310 [Candidatus Eremiobacteraeota bacterium]|nr:hypothetical protein [Candidatus Eremiobacteraeota bacterium]
MTRVIDILEEYKSEGEFDSVGHFTLDKKKAREKMKKYQLIYPHYYVLELVQAAVASGATNIEVYVDADDCIITFDGEPYSREDLDSMYSSLFVSQSDLRLERYRELAIGINSALALNPKFIKLISGDGNNAVEFSVIPPGEEIVRESDEIINGTRIHVKDRISWRVAGKFFAKHFMTRLPPEGQIIKEKCIFCRVPIILNKDMINPEKQIRLQDVYVQIDFQRDGLRGLLGIPRQTHRLLHLQFIKWGVTISKKTLPIPPGCLATRGIVEANNLIKNASQSDLVENKSFKTTVKQILEVEDELILKLVEMFLDMESQIPDEDYLEIKKLLIHSLEDRFDLSEYRRKPTELIKKLAQAELFETTDYKLTSLETLTKQYHEIKYVPYSKKFHKDPHPDNLIVAHIDDNLRLRLLNKLLPPRLKEGQSANVEVDFLKKFTRDKNIEKWNEKKGTPLILLSDTISETRLQDKNIDAVMGLTLRSPDDFSRIRFFKENGFITETYMIAGGLFFDAAVNNDKLLPNYTWDDVEKDEVFTDTVNTILSYCPKLYMDLAEKYNSNSDINDANREIIRRHLLRYINFVLSLQPEKHEKGKKKKTRKSKRKKSGFTCKIIDPATARKTDKSSGYDEVTIPNLKLVLPDSFLNLKIFDTVSGEMASLNDLQGDLEKFFAVYYITNDMFGPQMDKKHVVVVRDFEESVLKKYFGWYKITNYEKGLKAERDALKNMNRPGEKSEISSRTIGKVKIKHDKISGEMGLLKIDDPGAYSYRYEGQKRVLTGMFQVRILKMNRYITTKMLDLPVGGIQAVINYDNINVNSTWSDVIEDDNFEEIKHALAQACKSLAEQLLENYEDFYSSDKTRVKRYLLQYARIHTGRLDYESKSQEKDALGIALKKIPFFKTTLTLKEASLEELIDNKKKYGTVAIVENFITGELEGDRLICFATDFDKEALSDFFGTDGLENVEKQLQTKKMKDFVKRTKPILKPEITSRTLICKISIKHQEIIGEIGIPRYSFRPNEKLSQIRVLKENRFVVNLLTKLPIQVEACINYNKLQTNKNWSAIIEDENYRELKETLNRNVYMLIEELHKKYSELGETDRMIAEFQFLSFLTNSFSKYTDIRKAKPGSFINRLAVMPILTALGNKKVSFLDLVDDYEKSKIILYVMRGINQSPLDPEKNVFILTKESMEQLKKYFYHFHDYSEELAKERIARKNMSKAKIENLKIEQGYITKINIGKKGFKGELALPDYIPHREKIVFTRGLIPIIEKPLYRGSMAFGYIEKPEFQVNKTFNNVILTQSEKRVILEVIYKLYENLIEKYQKMEPGTDREIARRLLLDFYHEQKNVVESEYKIMENKLEQKISSLPLLPIADGRYVDINVILDQIERLGYIPYILKYENLLEPTEEVVFKLELYASDYAFFEKMFGISRLKNYNRILRIRREDERLEAIKRRRAGELKVHMKKRREDDLNDSRRSKEIKVEFEYKEQDILKVREKINLLPESSPIKTSAGFIESKQYKGKISIKTEPAKLTPDKKLLFSLKKEFRIIRSQGDYKLSDSVLKNMIVGRFDEKFPVFFDRSIRLLSVNSAHPFIIKVMNGIDNEPDLMYYLVSLIYSTINKELKEITDEDEIKFQTSIFKNLLKYKAEREE